MSAKKERPRVIKAQGDIPQVANTMILREVTRPKIKTQSLPDKLANDEFFHKNYFLQESYQKYPNAKELWYVDRYYPFAENGPLAVDEANAMDDINTLSLKKPILKEMGIRYICLKPEMTEMEAMEQLA